MNTKQILYNALTAQLETKKKQAEEYTDEVHNPSVADLKNSILEYFTNKVKGFNTFNFTGTNIRLEMGSSYYDRVEISLENSWKEEDKNLSVRMDWNGGTINSKANNIKGIEYLNVLNGVYNNFEEISTKYINEWYPKHKNIESKYINAWKEHDELKQALDKLSTEIKIDTENAMKQIGFEIKSFKPNYNLDWDYNNDSNERIYKIVASDRSFSIQYGRSQYDTTYVSGFKVIGKKGNKYKIDVYKDNQPTRTFDVLEKKFEMFISNVSNWENDEADKRAKKIQEDYESRTKK